MRAGGRILGLTDFPQIFAWLEVHARDFGAGFLTSQARASSTVARPPGIGNPAERIA